MTGTVFDIQLFSIHDGPGIPDINDDPEEMTAIARLG